MISLGVFFRWIMLKKTPSEIMNLPQSERNMMLTFVKYAIETGDIPITVKNFSGSNSKEA